jgi:hypothetical protein
VKTFAGVRRANPAPTAVHVIDTVEHSEAVYATVAEFLGRELNHE